MKRVLMFVLAFGLTATVCAQAFAAGPPEREYAWANDMLYQFLSTRDPAPASSAEELYIIGPIDPGMPQSTSPLPHDHVIPVPPNNGGAFSAVWRVFKVVGVTDAVSAGAVLVRPTGLAYEANLGAGLVPLTSVPKIIMAAQEGLVDLVNTGKVFVCPVVAVGRPY